MNSDSFDFSTAPHASEWSKSPESEVGKSKVSNSAFSSTSFYSESSDLVSEFSELWSHAGSLGDVETSEDVPTPSRVKEFDAVTNELSNKNDAHPEDVKEGLDALCESADLATMSRIFVGGIPMESIQKALSFLEVTQDRSKLIVYPGVYEIDETVSITFPVTIYGNVGESGEPVVFLAKKETVFEFLAGSFHSTISNITFLNCGFSGAVVLNGLGTSTIFNKCIFQVSQPNRETVLVTNQASPFMRKCVFNDGYVGILFKNTANGVITECEFNRNQLDGAQVTDGSAPSFSECHFSDNGSHGVTCFQNANGRFDRCVFEGNCTGMFLSENADPVVTNCDFRNMKTVAINIDESFGSFSKNRVDASRKRALEVRGKSSPIFHRNKFVNGSDAATIYCSGQPLFTENDIGHFKKGFWAEKLSFLTIRENMIHDIDGTMIVICGNAHIEKNTLSRCNSIGILVTARGEATILENTINQAKYGVNVSNDTQGILIQNNRIFDIDYSAVRCVFRSQATIRNNWISNSESGILCGQCSDVTAVENNVSHCKKYNILVHHDSTATITDNSICESGLDGIAIWSKGGARMSNNFIFDNVRDGVFVSGNNATAIQGNTIYGNKAFGVEIASNSYVNLTENEIHSNVLGGLNIGPGSSGLNERNELCENRIDYRSSILDIACLTHLTHNSDQERNFSIMGSMYVCVTCDANKNMRFCRVCRKKCHAGHDTVYVAFNSFYCHCGEGKMSAPCCSLIL